MISRRWLAGILAPMALVAGQARYARLGEFTGAVEVQLHPADAWMPAERNLPLPEGAWLRTGADGRAEVEFDDGSAWRLGPESQGGIADQTRLSTGQRLTLVTVERGLTYFTGQPQGSDSLVAVVPGAQLIFTRAARVRLEAREEDSWIAVLDGGVRFSSPAAELDLTQGQTTRVEPANAARFFLYREVAELELDRWNGGRDEALAHPSAGLHVAQRYGLAAMDGAGEWVTAEDLGTVWKPKVAEGWAPFQNGRWRWYDDLGYAWVSDDQWGWLPYHYGRWTHVERLGWVWAPGAASRFRAGDVYWVRGNKLAGWGPLAPGETWTGGMPQQFLNAYTTFAEYMAEARVIDPAGFAARPKDAQLVAAFVAGLAAPAVDSGRLDAMRPLVAGGRTRVSPVVDGVTYQTAALSAMSIQVIQPPPPPPVIIVENPPPAPAEPQQVLVPYPVAVYNGIVVPAKPVAQVKTAAAPVTVAAKASAAPSHPPVRNIPKPRAKRWQDDAEFALASKVVSETATPLRQLDDLDVWKHRYPHSDYAAERTYHYMQAYSRVTPPRPEKIVECGAELVEKEVRTQFDESDAGRAEALAVLYLMAQNGRPRENISVEAGLQLQRFLPEFFTADRRPVNVSLELWEKARADMEMAARKAIGGSRGMRASR